MWLDNLPSRSRTAILWAVGFFLIAQLTLMVTIERWRPDWSDPEYGTRFRHLKRRIQKEPGRPLLLVLGSSRVGNGLVADCLPPDSSQGSRAASRFQHVLSRWDAALRAAAPQKGLGRRDSSALGGDRGSAA
jgi:hypothetical protein